MRVLGLTVLAALGFTSQTVRAFTNGTLLPSYLCNNPDGYPKSAGTLIPFLQLGTAADNYNQFPPGNNTAVPIAIGANPPVAGAAIAPTARQIVGAFHNGGAQEDANGNTILPQVYEKSSAQPVWLAPMNANAITGQVETANGYLITPGLVHQLVVASHCPAPDIRGFNNGGVALDGFFAYAVDTGTGQRVGSWVNVGPTMTNWYACAIGANVSASVGIVHNQLVSGNSNVAGLTWQAPANITGLIKFVGAGVSDCAFGPFNITYNVTTAAAKGMFAPSPTAQGLNPNLDAANQATFVQKDAANDLPQTPAATTYVGTPAMPQAFQAATTTTTTTTTAYSPAATAGIAIAGSVAGGIVVGGIMFFVGRRQTSSSKAPLLL